MDKQQLPRKLALPNELLIEMVNFFPLPKCQNLMAKGPINYKMTEMIKPRAKRAKELFNEHWIWRKGVENAENKIAHYAFGWRICGGLYESLIKSGKDKELFSRKYSFSKPLSQFLHSWANSGYQILLEDEEKLKFLNQFNADWEMVLQGKYAEMPQWNYF